MKKVLLLFLSMLLSLGMFSACSSDNDIANVSDGLPSAESDEKECLEIWELRTFDKGWLQIVTFRSNEVVCRIYAKNIIEVVNKTDTNLSPFVNSGKYLFQVYSKDVTELYKPKGSNTYAERTISKDFISIDGIEYYYWIDKDGTLHLSQNYECDGPRYDFVKIK